MSRYITHASAHLARRDRLAHARLACPGAEQTLDAFPSRHRMIVHLFDGAVLQEPGLWPDDLAVFPTVPHTNAALALMGNNHLPWHDDYAVMTALDRFRTALGGVDRHEIEAAKNVLLVVVAIAAVS